jgi:hypothetical protein
MVRVRSGKHTFVGELSGPSKKKYPRGTNRMAYGLVVLGKDFELDFAWWDWSVEPLQAVPAE